jgi:putative serine protease PepD
MKRVFLPFAALVAAATLGGIAGAGLWSVTDDDSGAPGAASTAAPATTTAPVVSRAGSVASVYRTAVRSVVTVTVQSAQGTATGSGFVYDGQGRIVTNQHVVDGAATVSVRYHDGREIDAGLVGTDPSTDIALLRPIGGSQGVPALPSGSSTSLEVGDPLIAIGSPFGLEGTLTTGVVSGLGREIQAPDGFAIDGAIQTDAAINQGNSGGPLLDGAGRVVGVNSQIQTETGGNDGIGYAVPIETVRNVVDQLLKSGQVRHAYLGVRLADADNSGGARIERVVPGTPADRAGLQDGDVVVRAGSETVGDGADLRAAVNGHTPGERLELRVKRAGSERTVTVTLGERPVSD